MEHQESGAGQGMGRDAMLARLRDEMEDMDWRSVQVAERVLAPFRLTFPQAAVLGILHRHGPDLEMSQIAAHTGLPPSTITSIMDRLLHRHLAVRRTHPTDRRRVTGSITDEGRKVVDELLEKRRALLSHLLSSFSDDEIATLYSMVSRLTAMSEQVISSGEWPMAHVVPVSEQA